MRVLGTAYASGGPLSSINVAFRIEQIERRTEALRAVTPCLFADARAVTAQVRSQGIGIERLDAHAQMIGANLSAQACA